MIVLFSPGRLLLSAALWLAVGLILLTQADHLPLPPPSAPNQWPAWWPLSVVGLGLVWLSVEQALTAFVWITHAERTLIFGKRDG